MQSEHAIVIGGGIAGLLAATVLSNHFHTVTIVDRDQYPKDPVFRSGVPQGRHAHQLLKHGQTILETFFPGIQERLLLAGATPNDFIDNGVYNYGYGQSPRFPSKLTGIVCSRLLIEWQIRQELTQRDNIRFIENHEVIGLCRKDGWVTGIKTRERKQVKSTATVNDIDDINATIMTANLVVDASGRSSQASKWLEAIGSEIPSETVVNAYLGYASRIYAIPEEFSDNWNILAAQGLPEHQLRGGGIFRIEDNRWMVVMAGVAKDYPPTDEEGYLAFAKSLIDPGIYDAIKDAKPLSPIYGYRDTENRVRHFERMQCLEGFIAIGDAVCAFNPIYGQGMMAAAQAAQVLDRCLIHSSFSSRRFQQKLARTNKSVWQLATSSDYRMPATIGPKLTKLEQWLLRYMGNILPLLASDRQVLETFLSVIHFTQPSTALLHPTIVYKVLFRKTV